MEDLVQIRIRSIRKTTFPVDIPIYDGWMDRSGRIISNESHHHVEKALEIIAEADEILTKKGKTPHYMNDFKLANQNKGYDAGEFLVVVFGYIAIEGKKVIYNCEPTGTTSMQRRKLGVILEDGVLILEPNKSIEEKANARERQWCIDNREYYSNWRNKFHCPSGFPRQDYLRWQNLCKKHGVCTSTRRTYFTSY